MDAASLNARLSFEKADLFTAKNDFFLMPGFRDAWNQILAFRQTYSSALTAQVTGLVDNYQAILVQWVINKRAATPDITHAALVDIMMAVCAARARIDFLMTGNEESMKRQIERAFIHLKRSLVADSETAARWQTAFAQVRAEEACESLGSVHLLLHGIWAFKAHSPGERTDLVMGHQPVDLEEAERSAEAMVLTEWKIARTQNDVNPQVQQAFTQASIYAGSGLAGFELSTIRYLVIVTEDRMKMPADPKQGDVLYRIINIAVRPSTPSASRAI